MRLISMPVNDFRFESSSSKISFFKRDNLVRKAITLAFTNQSQSFYPELLGDLIHLICFSLSSIQILELDCITFSSLEDHRKSCSACSNSEFSMKLDISRLQLALKLRATVLRQISSNSTLCFFRRESRHL